MKRILSLSLLILFLISCGNKKTSEENRDTKQHAGNSFTAKNADFILAFGSCNKQELPQPLWDPILENRPDVFVWGGDNIYADTDDMAKLEAGYQKQKSHAGYQKLLGNTEVLAVWDDHDYGKNDTGAEFEHKKESQQKFLDFLDVSADDPRRSREGIWHSRLFSTRNGSVKMILLDTRYFRSPLLKSADPEKRYELSPEGTVLGEVQWNWLKEELTSSKADFNVLVSSIQFLSAEHGFETWGNFPAEVGKLQELIVSSGAKNVILLSGDRHISEFSKTNLPGIDYPLIDFTSSGLTHTYSGFTGEPNRYRAGEVVKDLSFGLLLFDLQNKKVIMQMRGEENVLQQELVQIYQ